MYKPIAALSGPLDVWCFAGVLTSVGIAEIDKSVYALGVPMMYASYDEVYWVLEKMRPRLEAARRTADFGEVVGGLDKTTALHEARRCLSCGSCFGCDNCYGVCPDNAVHKVADGDGYAIDYDYCKGCGLCVAECPAGAIELVPEVS